MSRQVENLTGVSAGRGARTAERCAKICPSLAVLSISLTVLFSLDVASILYRFFTS
jgi:hypothetical protein